MAVDDSGGRRQQGGDAVQRRFEPLGLGAIQPLQILNTVAVRSSGDRFQTRHLGFARRDDQFSYSGMRDAVVLTISVEAVPAGDAGAGFQAADRIVEPAMNDLAVARRSLKPDRVGTLEDEDAHIRQGEGPRHRQPDDTRPDNDALDFFHRPEYSALRR